MSNSVYTTITAKGKKEDLEAFLEGTRVELEDEKTKEKYKRFTFDKIIPEPKTIDECEPLYIIKPGEDRDITDAEQGEWFNWLHWRISHWGTKWNACDPEIDVAEDGLSLVLRFSTAWDEPNQIYDELRFQYPDITFEIEYIEEQGVENLGKITLHGLDDVITDIPAPRSKAAYEMMFDMWNNRESYIYDKDEDSYVNIPYQYEDFAEEWGETHEDDETAPDAQDWYDNYGGKQQVAKDNEEEDN